MAMRSFVVLLNLLTLLLGGSGGVEGEDQKVKVNLNPQSEEIGKGFIQHYYKLFDNPATRPKLADVYHKTESQMSFEGVRSQGAEKIMETLNDPKFQKVSHNVQVVDTLPMFDGGILINVIGHITVGDHPIRPFSQTFVLSGSGSGMPVCNQDIFRILDA